MGIRERGEEAPGSKPPARRVAGQTRLTMNTWAPDFTGWEHDNAKFEDQFEQVVRALRSDEGTRERAPQPKL